MIFRFFPLFYLTLYSFFTVYIDRQVCYFMFIRPQLNRSQFNPFASSVRASVCVCVLQTTGSTGAALAKHGHEDNGIIGLLRFLPRRVTVFNVRLFSAETLILLCFAHPSRSPGTERTIGGYTLEEQRERGKCVLDCDGDA